MRVKFLLHLYFMNLDVDHYTLDLRIIAYLNGEAHLRQPFINLSLD